MSVKPWSELTVAERRKFSVQARRNPRKAYEKIVPETPSSTPEEPEVEPFTPVVYTFTSYSDAEKTTEWGSGTVETTDVESNGYTKVTVKTNTDESFVGNEYYIVSNAKTDGTVYELFTDAGTTSAGIYVTIGVSE